MATTADALVGIQQDADGNYFDVVDLGDGSGKQIFKGRTVAELITNYRNAQVNATRKIREQSRELKLTTRPDPAREMRQFRPHQPTANELWQLGEDLKDPAKAAAAQRRAFEWELGASMDEVRASLQEREKEKERVKIHANAAAFMDEHPEFVPCTENEEAIYGYLDARALDYSKRNLEIAFSELRTGLVLRSQRQETPAPTPDARIEQPQAVTRPRVASTGLTSRTSSAVPPSTGPLTNSALAKLADEIDAMPTPEYERRLRDPQWSALAERALAARNPRR